MNRLFVAGCLLPVLTVSLVAQEAKSDHEAIQGKWELVKVTYNGKASDLKEKSVWVITDKQIQYESGSVDDYQLDAKKKPKEIIARQVREGKEDEYLLGIYELEGTS
jgi:uncharacterized protein (TIGR03067 family)